MTSPRPELSSTPSSAVPAPHRSGRAVALCVFLLGVVLLGVVFALAYELFRAPVPGLGLSATPGAAVPPPATAIGSALAAFVRQIVLLLLMTIAGSVMAGKGIALYFSCAHKP